MDLAKVKIVLLVASILIPYYLGTILEYDKVGWEDRIAVGILEEFPTCSPDILTLLPCLLRFYNRTIGNLRYTLVDLL